MKSSGKVTFRPIHADLNKERTIMGTLDPYCQISYGKQKVKSNVCKNGGAFPDWNDALIIDRGYEPFCYLELKDKEKIHDWTIGSTKIDLDEVMENPQLSRWYDIYDKQELIGQILVESTFRQE